ncbi:MAG: hypothetical protein HY902_07380, partial [Deltaproteobacteria bacterium]|nr:hypothetical protein [Deltaproteobacteria bacterium]
MHRWATRSGLAAMLVGQAGLLLGLAACDSAAGSSVSTAVDAAAVSDSTDSIGAAADTASPDDTANSGAADAACPRDGALAMDMLRSCALL